MGRLPQDLALDVEQHLASCAKCRMRLESQTEYWRAMKAAAVRLGAGNRAKCGEHPATKLAPRPSVGGSPRLSTPVFQPDLQTDREFSPWKVLKNDRHSGGGDDDRVEQAILKQAEWRIVSRHRTQC